MKQLHYIKRKLPLFLIIGILILCASFILINCGKGPQQKINNHDAGPYAVNFLDCPTDASNSTPGLCWAVVDSSAFKTNESKKMAARELTAEAWVKLKGTSTSGAIFGRMDSSGIMLYVKDNVPKAAVRRVIGAAGSTSTVDIIVGAPTFIQNKIWTHVAAVLSFTNSTSTPSTLDLYVNGQLVATTDSTVFPEEFTEPGGNLMGVGSFITLGSETILDSLPGSSIFEGIIDEPRLWGVARTQNEIQACMNRELSLDNSTCGRLTDDLIGYLRFNEGQGEGITDLAGLGTGAKEYGNSKPTPGHETLSWDTGWTTDTPGLNPAD